MIRILNNFFLLPLVVIFFIISCNTNNSISKDFEEKILLGKWSEDKINSLLSESRKYKTSSEKIDYISSEFLDTQYLDHTLTGDINTNEVFTINLEGVDCFTYLDYVQALNISRNYNEFKKNLVSIRYKDRKVDFLNRNHFFTDWAFNNSKYIKDATKKISPDNAETISKNLNVKKDGSTYLEGLPPNKRDINYIPSDKVDQEAIENIKTGDYIGIYTNLSGLDVTHTGIAVKKEGTVYLRHASSKSTNRKVVDENLIDYIQSKKGIVILRPN